MTKPAELRLGTSAFTAAGWEGSFYPEGMPAREFLSYYSQKFDTVEVDSTFYRSPSHSTVRGWYEKTPKDFIFSAKVPQIITHEKCLVDCGEDLATYLGAMELLGEKLGPLLFQFGYFNKKAFKTVDEFLARLDSPSSRNFRRATNSLWRFATNIGWFRNLSTCCGNTEWRWRWWIKAGCWRIPRTGSRNSIRSPRISRTSAGCGRSQRDRRANQNVGQSNRWTAANF